MPNLLYPKSLRSAALLYGVGNSSVPYLWGAANKNALGFWVKSNATSGDARGLYMRLYLNGAGGGEAIRAFATATASSVATGGTMNGIHATASIGTGGTISGAANAVRATLGVTAGLTPGGTLASLLVDTDIGASCTIPDSHSFIRVSNAGTGTFKNLLNVPAPAAGGAVFATHSSTAFVGTHSLKIIDAAGTAYYIMVSNVATGRAT